MSKQSKQPTKCSAQLLQCTNKPELELLVYDKLQEHQLSLLPQPLVSIELSEPPQVQKDVPPLTQEIIELVERYSNIYLSRRLSQMPSESSDMKSEDFDLDDLESKNRSLDEEIGVRNETKDSKLGKGKSRADKLPELPVEDFNILNKNEESYFYIDKDEKRDEETTQLKQASNKKTEHEKMNEVLTLLLNTEVYYSEISETDKDSQEKNHPKNIPSWAYIISESEDEKVSETSSKRRQVTDYDRSIMYSRNSELETGESSTI
ncbi:4206_t:CDS:2, partial [Gigaspora margarita]